MSFAGDLSRFSAKVTTRSRDVFVNVASAAKYSITDGSAVTASPGQPVDTGFLKASWQLTYPSEHEALIATNCVYAPTIEFNVRGATLRSTVGGFHSVALTIGGFQRLVDTVTGQTPE